MVKKAHHHNNSHIPVLFDDVMRILAPKSGETYLDLTAGYGGHAQGILERTGNAAGITLVDRDNFAITALRERFTQKPVSFIHQDFANAASELKAKGKRFDMILLDLGVSSPHLDNAERGFSFQSDAPLDMRMDQRQQVTAQSLVNELSEAELTRILKVYGEEPRAKKVAQALIMHRPIQSTSQLANIVEDACGRRGKIHPATRTFQALRIAVNDELRQLERVLPVVLDLLIEQGRVAVISFHSLEDRIVKHFLASEASNGYEARLKVLTKKPLSGAHNDVLNRRARSAKLRAAIKINT